MTKRTSDGPGDSDHLNPRAIRGDVASQRPSRRRCCSKHADDHRVRSVGRTTEHHAVDRIHLSLGGRWNRSRCRGGRRCGRLGRCNRSRRLLVRSFGLGSVLVAAGHRESQNKNASYARTRHLHHTVPRKTNFYALIDKHALRHVQPIVPERMLDDPISRARPGAQAPPALAEVPLAQARLVGPALGRGRASCSDCSQATQGRQTSELTR